MLKVKRITVVHMYIQDIYINIFIIMDCCRFYGITSFGHFSSGVKTGQHDWIAWKNKKISYKHPK